MAITAPRNFAGDPSTTSVVLTWRLCSDAIVRIYRSDAEPWSSYHQVGQVEAGSPGTFTDTGLSAATEYYYFASALDGGRELPCTAISITTDSLPGPPTAPSGLTLTSATTSTLAFSWTDNSSNEDTFELQLTEILTSTVYWRTVVANTTSTSRGSLPHTTLFWARIRAKNTSGFSSWSSTILVATTAPQRQGSGGSGTDLPRIPTAFRVVVTGETSANFEWSDNSSNEQGFRIRLGGAANTVYEVGPDITSLSVNDLLSASSYTATIEAHSQAGVGTESGATCFPSSISFTTDPPRRNAPIPPVDLQAVEVGPAVVRITFDASATGGDTVSIWRDTVPTTGNTEIVDNLLPLATTYIDSTGLVTSTTYRYTATATNTTGTSAASDSDDVTITASLEEVATPYSHTLVAVDSATLQASWAIDGSTHDLFKLEISATASTGPWSTVSDTILPQVRAYTITGKDPNTQYWTRVTAYSGGLGGFASAASNVATATTADDLLAVAATGPIIETVRNVAPGSALVYFRPIDATARSYQARIRTIGGAYANNGSALTPDNRTAPLTGLSGATTYEVVIRATNDGGTGDSDAYTFITAGSGGGPGLSARHQNERHYRRRVYAADANITIPTTATDALISFDGQTSDNTDGPFANLYVDATKVSPAYVGGHSKIEDYEVQGGETVTVQVTGAGSGTSLFRLIVKPQ